MSLLMKALEKAAKDREDADAGRVAAGTAAEPSVDLGILSGAAQAPAVAAPAARSAATTEFTLEPLAAPAESRTPPLAPPPAAPPPAPSPRPAPAAARPSPATASATPEPALAASVVRAGQRATGGGVGGAVTFLREHRMVVFGPLTALVLIGYGIYIYLQMTSPTQVASKPPPRPLVASGSTTAAAPQPPIPLAAVMSPQPEEAARKGPASVPAAAPPAASQPAASAAAAAPASIPAAEPAAPAAAAASRDSIKITAGGATPAVNPLLTEAYAALVSGDLDAAPRLYNQVLRSDPNNLDALLGLAAVATQQGDSEQASRRYLKVLDVEPRNALAQAGLIGMLGRADPLAAETRLKQLIARDPSAYLYFTLGNVYADQNRWPDAQQAYFQAHYLQSGNPDYAYNLAVGLEHIGQPKLALEYYRRALQSVAATGRANFSAAAVTERIGKLETAVEK